MQPRLTWSALRTGMSRGGTRASRRSQALVLLLWLAVAPLHAAAQESMTPAAPAPATLETPATEGAPTPEPCDVCPELVEIPGGTFQMGSPSNEPGRHADESPEHAVTIAPFLLARTEVTFAQWDACVAEQGCEHRPADVWGRGDQPVMRVSYEDALAYVTWLSRKTGQAYRLPSEAEWEYAARAGTTTPFAFGPTITSAEASYNGELPYNRGVESENRARTVAAGSLPANAFGLREMHGNVWEWTADCYADSYVGTPNDGSPREASNCTSRVLRGGSWFDRAANVRSASRVGRAPGFRSYLVGFRVARSR